MVLALIKARARVVGFIDRVLADARADAYEACRWWLICHYAELFGQRLVPPRSMTELRRVVLAKKWPDDCTWLARADVEADCFTGPWPRWVEDEYERLANRAA